MKQREGLVERYERLERRQEELRDKAVNARSHDPVHLATVRVLSDLMTMGARYSTARVPAGLRAMMLTLQRMEPVLVEELAKVPPDQIRVFLGELAGRLQSIVDTPHPEPLGARSHLSIAAAPDQPRPDQSSSA